MVGQDTRQDPPPDRKPGGLLVVPTPIGNLGDMPPRAAEALRTADRIACEDTRVTGKLLSLLGLPHRPLVSYREENETTRSSELADAVAAGETIVLVSDAGLPTLSDPGFRLVRECRKRGLPVSGIPGPFAGAFALALSGLPTNAFWFVGFLPPKSEARKRFHRANAEFPHTIVLYESVHRIDKHLGEILEVLGPERVISLARELTKRHESVHTGTVETVLARASAEPRKGEYVLLVAPREFSL